MKYTSQEKSKNLKIKEKKEISIIKKINRLTDDKFANMSKVLDKKNNYNIKFNKDSNELELFDGEKKILSAIFNFYGIIKPDGRFMWAYMIPGIDRRIVSKIDKIKSFSHLFENSNDKKMLLFHQILTQDSIMLDSKEVNDLNKLILYLSEDMYFFNTPNNSGNIQLIYISKITEKYI